MKKYSFEELIMPSPGLRKFLSQNTEELANWQSQKQEAIEKDIEGKRFQV